MPKIRPPKLPCILIAATLCIASWCSQAQTGDLASDARFKASIDAFRQKLLPVRHNTNVPVGEKTLKTLLTRLARVDNIGQLCEQGLGSQRLCATRVAQIDEGLGASIGNPMLHAMDLSPFRSGLGTVVSAALKQPENLSESKTKASLTLTELQQYTGRHSVQQINPRWFLRGLLGQLPTLAMSGELRGFKSAEQASMAGELLADFADHLMETLGDPLERCAPENLSTLGGYKAWYATSEAAAVTGCMGEVLGASETTELLHKVGLILQLPEQWMAQGLFFADNRADFRTMALLGRVMQSIRIKSSIGTKSAFTYLLVALPFSVDGTTCEADNSYCATLVDRLDERARCVLDGQTIGRGDCREVAKTLSKTTLIANHYEAYTWALGFDILRALQGKSAQTKVVKDYMAMVTAVSDNFASLAGEPQSSLVMRFKQVTQIGFLFDSQAWVVDSITLRH